MAANHLHGHVQIKIKQARNLPDMESWFSKLSSRKNVTDAYVDVRLGSARLARTKYVADSLNPSWNETYRREVCHFTDMLRFEVNDKDTIGSDHIGVASIPTASLIGEKSVKGWLDIEGEDGSKNGQLKVSVKYTSRESIEKTYRVPCYFPMRENCSVTLYQDAEVPPGTTQLDDFSGNQVESPRCWRDVYDMIIGAKHLICITGWAVWTQLVLKRSADLPEDERNLGDILIKKADEGVSVHVMIWNDNTSGDMIGKDGFMGTHDMETFYVFNGTNVHCALAPRVMECNEITDLLYTHHQKSIICDAEDLSGSGKRRLVAFVGGLDLTNGRYDTPAHPLFCTLLNEHKDDFHNANAPTVPASQGPREPWHDIHSKVEGPIAYDIFRNFHERWQQQGTSYGSLDSIDQSKIDVHSPAPSSLMDPHNSWNVQLFRSISSDSAKFSKKESKCLNTKHSQLVESSIQQAYVQMIRNAENFIYIENQYFFGSAFCWLSDNSTKCKHIIPNEIAHKIVTKIRTGERFCAYILIPMFPEGDPASSASQEILYWQTKTMEMMYHKIGKTIAEEGSDTHPTDWLLFLCLAKREPRGDYLNELEPDTEPMAMKLRFEKTYFASLQEYHVYQTHFQANSTIANLCSFKDDDS